MSKEFTCDCCERTFNQGCSDEEAYEEAYGLFGKAVIEEALLEGTTATMCDDCFAVFMEFRSEA